MKVQKLGDGLAISLPDEIVEALKLKEGDQVTLTVGPGQTLQVERESARQAAVARFLSHARPTPPGFKFSRDEANER